MRMVQGMWGRYEKCEVQEMKKKIILVPFLPYSHSSYLHQFLSILIFFNFFQTLFALISSIFSPFTQYYCWVKLKFSKNLGVQGMWGWYKECEEGTRNEKEILVPFSHSSYIHQFLNILIFSFFFSNVICFNFKSI